MRLTLTAIALLIGMTGAHAQLLTFPQGAGTVGNLLVIGPSGNQMIDSGTAALSAPAVAPYGVSMTATGSLTNPTLTFTACGAQCGWLAPGSGQLEVTVGGVRKLDYALTNSAQWTFNAGIQMGNNGITAVANLLSNTAGSYELLGTAASGTVATLIPNRGDTTTGIGAGGNAKLDFIVSSTAQGDWGDTNASAWTFTSHVFLTGLSTSSGAQTSYICQTTNQLIAVAVANTCATSSARFKEDIADLPLGLDAVMALRPIIYHYKFTGDDKFDYAPGQRSWQLGFTAEQAASIDTRLITYNVDGDPHAFRYEQYVAVLTRAIQEQQEQIDALRNEIRGRH